MPSRASIAATSLGVCTFCQTEIAKNKMTQHLKFCKQRATAISTENQSRRKKKTSLFHILVEGQYNPQYWMHLELAASEPLDTLDAFLRDIWLECCGHLSAFTIDKTHYETQEEEIFFLEPSKEVLHREEKKEEDVSISIEKILAFFPSYYLEVLPAEMLADIKKLSTVDETVAFARSGIKALPKDSMLILHEDYFQYQAQEALLKWLLNLEDCSLNAQLAKVLKVGDKFFHEYDFGSTTYLQLRVIAEREGVVRKKSQPVEIMARNLPPTLPCDTCGNPATLIVTDDDSGDEQALCAKCAKKAELDEEWGLPVVNSPRMGVCGYGG